LDGVCGITRASGVYTADPNDPDCTAGTAQVAVSGDTVSGADGQISVQVKINADGSATVTDVRPSGDGNTVTTRIGVTAPDGSGNVAYDGFFRGYTEGSGSEGTETPVAGLCGAPGQPACRLDETGTPTDSGSMASGNTALDTAQSAGETAIATYGTSAKKTDLGITFGITWPDVACSDPVFSVFGRSMTVQMCVYEDDVNSIMGWFMWVLAAFSVFGMIREIR